VGHLRNGAAVVAAFGGDLHRRLFVVVDDRGVVSNQGLALWAKVDGVLKTFPAKHTLKAAKRKTYDYEKGFGFGYAVSGGHIVSTVSRGVAVV
jgi:hypothetical protein